MRAAGSDKFGLAAAPLGTTVSSGKVRLYFDMMMGVITNTSTSGNREIISACFLSGNDAPSRAYTSSASVANARVCLVNDDDTDGTELYSCNFEYGYRMSVQNAAPLVGNADREGADRWIRRGNAYGTISAVDAGAGFHGFFGGGLDDPYVALVDNLSVKALRGGTLLIVR